MSSGMITALQSTGVSGAEEESRSAVATYIAQIITFVRQIFAYSAVATYIAQIITFVRQIFAYLMEYMRKLLEWTGEHPLASVLLLTNIMVWIS